VFAIEFFDDDLIFNAGTEGRTGRGVDEDFVVEGEGN